MMNLDRFTGERTSKPVEQIDLNTGEVIKEWVSRAEAEKKMRISKYYMGLAITGKTSEVGGFGWRYK